VLRACVALSIFMVCGASWAAPPLHWSASAEVEGATGYDTNLFLQIAASPDSPNYHAYEGAFMRLHPVLAGARIGNGFRFELRYGADLIQTFGAGRLYLQDADLSLVIPELGPFGLRVVATGGRFDAGQLTTDSFWSWGGRAQLTVRARETVRAAATYELDHRQFVDATVLQIRGDLGQSARLAAIWSPSPAVDLSLDGEYLSLSSDPVDPTQASGPLRRFRGGLGASYIAFATVTTSVSTWAGTQSTDSVETDRQFGGALAVSMRAGGAIDVIGRYDLLLNRAMAGSSNYARHVLTLALVGHLDATPARAAAAPADAAEAPLIQSTRVRFRVRAQGAATVVVIGSWNDWAADRPAQRLRATRDPDLWEGWVDVGAGDHRYHFLVDGRPVRPVDAPRYLPDDFGGEDGVLAVEADSVYRR
jgi:hypothetical protein